MPIQVLQRPNWDGHPTKQTEFFRLTKSKDGGTTTAVCELWSHVFGWDARLLIRGELRQSRVCRDQDSVLDTIDEWKAALVAKGWA
jgi:hypothetical protein